MSMPEQKLYIGGRYVDASSGASFETINPANGELICKVQKASAADVDKAVESCFCDGPVSVNSGRSQCPLRLSSRVSKLGSILIEFFAERRLSLTTGHGVP